MTQTMVRNHKNHTGSPCQGRCEPRQSTIMAVQKCLPCTNWTASVSARSFLQNFPMIQNAIHRGTACPRALAKHKYLLMSEKRIPGNRRP